MQNIKVLVADDEVDILKVMEKRISEAGYNVITASDGAEAWEKIQSESPDVIVLDLVMPRLDGLTLLKYLRESPPTDKWQPVIIVSAKGELEDMARGFSLEADHYIPKPCDMQTVLQAIRLMVSLIPQRKKKSETE